jgi:putative photosynthetic complex assembly protein 2
MQLALAALFTVMVWWASTGAILYLDGLPQRTFKWTFGAASLLLILAVAGLAASSAYSTVGSAYCAFACTVLIWAWQEVAFLLGYVTGPRRLAATPGLSGWPRAREAFATVLHHELALVLLGATVLVVTWGQPNLTGLWTYLVLWAMRSSAKLNIFLGVRNLYESFLPAHLRYLESYFRARPMNPLFPFSVLAGTAVLVPLWLAANAPGASPAQVASLGLVGSLLGLAVLEHWFLILPLPSQNLWKWGLRSRSVD